MVKKKLEWQGGILHSSTDEPIAIRNKKSKTSPVCHDVFNEETKKITGRCNLRLEKKGRAGNPAIILFKFSDPEAKNPASLKKLCADLKMKLACGGTTENNEILLTLQDTEKVKKILANFFDIKV